MLWHINKTILLIKFKIISASSYYIRCNKNFYKQKKILKHIMTHHHQWRVLWQHTTTTPPRHCHKSHHPPARRPYIYTKTLLTLNVRKSVPPAPFFEPDPPNQQEETATNINLYINCPTFRKKFRLRLRRSPVCLPFQIQRRIMGVKVGNLKTQWFHVENDSQQRADKTGEAGFVGLILEK